ncbi:MAG TPA: serine/threonine-protein kinase [Gemmatimonadaceae bacterium]|nr:serine/threonine-protein kinase [Gemmatimonadaceae bacterium]
MTPTLRDRLQATLGDAYAIERELDGGGMSQVFVAEERSLGRRVVVKVLPPDLSASISADRFRREIQVAARLQHPHIVPVFAASETDGLLYYTMPFVEGESLRARLVREPRLPIDEVVSVLRDVGEALAYAHRFGVVHRDIKPENVLLSGNVAVVLDFGIAKAITAARTEGDGALHTLTRAGISLGTPAYMAPEQAAADPTIDQRADLYALGVVAYEMLAGTPPFDRSTVQALLTAHLTEAPVEVSEKRPDAPPALAALVMRLLEKSPDARTGSAEELLAQLSAITSGAHATSAKHAGWGTRRIAVVAAFALLIVVVGLAWPRWWRSRALAARVDDRLVVVAPFRVTVSDGSLAYLREGMLDLLAAKLTGEGGPRAINPRSVLVAWGKRSGSGNELSEDDGLRLAAGLGAGRLLLGEIVGTPTRIVINARLLAVPSGKALVQESVEGPPDSLASRVDALAARLLSVSAGEREHLGSLTSTSLPALREYLDGKALFRHGQYGAARQHFARALELDSTFALANLGIFEASYWEITPDIWDAARRATAVASRLSERDRAFLRAMTGPRFPEMSTAQDYISAGEHLVDAAPDDPEAWANLGDWLFHCGSLVGVADWETRAMAAYTRALALDSTFVPALGHYVLLAAHRGDTAIVRKHGALYVATDSAGETAQALRWRRALMLRDEPMLADIRARFADKERPIDIFSMWWITDLALHEAVGLDDGARALTAAGSVVDPVLRALNALTVANFALERGQPRAALMASETASAYSPDPNLYLRWRVLGALYGSGDSVAALDAVRMLERFADAPVAAGEARTAQNEDRCVVEQWRVLHGDSRRATDAVARMRAATNSTSPLNGARVEVRCAYLLDALIAYVEHRADAARATDRLDSLMRTGPDAGMLVGRFAKDPGNLLVAWLRERQGDLAGALTAAGRVGYVGSPVFLASQLREQGRLAVLSGDRARAIRAWTHYLVIRGEAEPPVQPEVDAVRRALADVQNGRMPEADVSGAPLTIRGPITKR